MLVSPRSFGVAAGATLFVTVCAIANHPYQVDALHSSVAFTVPVAGGLSTLQGRFNAFSATIDYDAENPSHSSVKASIDVTSLDTGVPARDKHTLGADGFYATKYPTIRFVSKRLSKSGDGFDCVGDLSLRGVKKEVTLHFRQTGTRNLNEHQQLVGFAGSFKIDRRDFGMKWQMSHNTDWIGNVAEIQLSILARPK